MQDMSSYSATPDRAGDNPLDRIHPEDRPAAEQAAARAFRNGVPQVIFCRQRQPDGSYLLAEFRAEPGYSVSVPVDPLVQTPGERWTVAESFGETADAVRAAKVIEQMHGAAFAFDATGKFTYATPIAQTSIAMTLDDLNRPLGGGAFLDGGDLGWKLGVHPDDYPGAAERLRHCMRTGENFNYEYRVLRASGDYVWHRFAIRPTRSDDGRITGWYGIGFDIDVYKRTEAALRESERSLQALIETLPAMVYCANPDGRPTFRSRRLREFLGLDAVGKDGPDLAGTLAAIIHPDDLAGVRENYRHCLATGDAYARRHRLRRFDGVYRWVETRATPMRDADGKIVQWNGICLDIEDQVSAQEELRVSRERLARASQAASLAELSASVAHEVNQPLAAIVANSHAAQRWLAAELPNVERAQKAVERIIRDANAAADVVSRIRALFRQSADARTPAAIGSIVAQARELMAEDASRRGVQIDVELESELPLLAVDRVQMQQVLVNLMRNGMDAMDALPGEKILELRVAGAGDLVRIEIGDRGPGIAFPDRIFEPFFTTKGGGMGMGLAICRSIVEAHGGRLWAETNEPQGARFVFTLPVQPKVA